ncbi:AAA family ATPase [Jiella sp. MQZ9-1]|uniref:AAA family ATPase n=1 Tax=Jiella flava TaxID=2816857 RepID=A0A939FTJ5_9HYPH|nr:AAA family ATPase [Jiella flava]MBO0661140.1 AAA family ATPase [Jiella flava]MCD2469786.1 AAA family ATPase [Jiella flava]
MPAFVIISGCSGGGKSTLLTELCRRGFAVVEEPGRRIVASEQRFGGSALPWIDPAAFARRAVAMGRKDCDKASGQEGIVFFDRGLIDAAAALEFATGEACLRHAIGLQRVHRRVFMAPPWPEIFVGDDERRHDLVTARAEYERLVDAYSELGYELDTLPKISVGARADHLIAALAGDGLL